MPNLLVSADGSVERVVLTKKGHFLIDEDARMAWGIGNQHRREFLSEWVQVLTEVSCAPQHIEGEEKWMSDAIDLIIEECYDDEMQNARAEEKKNTLMALVKFVVLIFTLLTVVLVVAGLLNSGALHL